MDWNDFVSSGCVGLMLASLLFLGMLFAPGFSFSTFLEISTLRPSLSWRLWKGVDIDRSYTQFSQSCVYF